MSVDDFYTETFDIKRLEEVSGTSKLETNVITKGVSCMAQQQSPDSYITDDGHDYQLWKFYCEPTIDIQPGDTIVYQGNDYEVRNVTDYDKAGSPGVQHKKITARREYDYA